MRVLFVYPTDDAQSVQSPLRSWSALQFGISYNTCIQEGLIRGPLDVKRERMQPVLEHPHFTKAQIQSAHTWFDYQVYRGHKPLIELLLLCIMVKIRSNPVTNLLFRRIVQLPGLRHLRAKLAGN